jgi:hypothetical protein
MGPVTASCRLQKALIRAAEQADCMKNVNLKGQCRTSAPSVGYLELQIGIRPSYRGVGRPRLVGAPVNRRV